MLTACFGTRWGSNQGRGPRVWKVLIVEDDVPMREFFAGSVQRHPELVLLAGVGTAGEARALLDYEPGPVDVLLVDLGLPDGSGLDVIRHARTRHPECEALVISIFGDEDNVLASVEAGALGYIHKDVAPEDIAQTILDLKAGASPISPMIARRLLARYCARQSTPPTAPAPASEPAEERSTLPASPLSAREREVLGLIAQGLSYAEIARQQDVSIHTVQTHIKNLYGKLAVHSKGEAVYKATRLGLLLHR